jgi:hypothetical protein
MRSKHIVVGCAGLWVVAGAMWACFKVDLPETVPSGQGGGAGGGAESKDGGGGGTGDDDASLDGPQGTHLAGAGADAAFPLSSTTGYVVLVGGTVPVGPDKQVGYALTATAEKTYQFRWTGASEVTGEGYQEFYGSLWTTGSFSNFVPGCVNQVCSLESNDYLSNIQTVEGGQRIDWDTFASTGWDGFGFSTSMEPIYLEVFIDGAPHLNLFFFAETPDGGTTSPTVNPFGISSAQ